MPSHTLAGLRLELQKREPRIKRAASLLKIEFGPVEDPYDRPSAQYFEVYAWWQGGQLMTRFTGDMASKNLKPCQHMRSLIQLILNQRNI